MYHLLLQGLSSLHVVTHPVPVDPSVQSAGAGRQRKSRFLRTTGRGSNSRLCLTPPQETLSRFR